MAKAVSDAPAAPPSAVLRWTETWSRRTGGSSGVLTLALLLIEVIVLLVTFIGSQEMCSQPDALGQTRCNPGAQAGFWIGLVASCVGLFFLIVSFSTWRVRRRQAKRAREVVAQFAPRLQSAKDWPMAGRIDASVFARLRSHYEPLAQGMVPGEAVRAAGEILVACGLTVACIGPFVLLLLNLGLVRSVGGGVLALLAGPLAGIAFGIFLYVVGAGLRRRGRGEGEQAVAAAMAADDEVLRSARATATGRRA